MKFEIGKIYYIKDLVNGILEYRIYKYYGQGSDGYNYFIDILNNEYLDYYQGQDIDIQKRLKLGTLEIKIANDCKQLVYSL